jgi:molecular chaperone GrpE
LNRHNRPAPDPDAAPQAEPEEVEAELVDADDVHATTADELLAEVFDADQLEADLAAVESQAETVADEVSAGSSGVRDEVAALTADLQRVQAEFRNYKRRVERDREKENQRAVEKALASLLPVLDDLELAAAHDELVGGFKSVAEKLVGTLSGLGLTAFGAVGEPFDPVHHEALMRESVEGVAEPTVVRVLQVGYEMNGRIIRAARVSVAGTD